MSVLIDKFGNYIQSENKIDGFGKKIDREEIWKKFVLSSFQREIEKINIDLTSKNKKTIENLEIDLTFKNNETLKNVESKINKIINDSTIRIKKEMEPLYKFTEETAKRVVDNSESLTINMKNVENHLTQTIENVNNDLAAVETQMYNKTNQLEEKITEIINNTTLLIKLVDNLNNKTIQKTEIELFEKIVDYLVNDELDTSGDNGIVIKTNMRNNLKKLKSIQ